jgi:SAM-dependent methyltransferase
MPRPNETSEGANSKPALKKPVKPNFFEHGSPYLEHPLLTPQRTSGEIDFILSILPLDPGSRLLDIGCGFGRHSIELARRGFDVLGIDPSAAMIAAARERAAAQAVQPEFRRLAGQDLQLQDEFAAAICLFTTLGQVTGQEDNRELLPRAFHALQPGGHLVLEIPQPAWTLDNLQPAETLGEGETHTRVRRSFDPARDLVSEQFTVVSPAGQRTYLLRYRLFNRAQVSQLLAQAGFAGLAFYGGYAPVPLDDRCPGMVIRAQKPA